MHHYRLYTLFTLSILSVSLLPSCRDTEQQKKDIEVVYTPADSSKKEVTQQDSNASAPPLEKALEPLWTYQFDSIQQDFTPTPLKRIRQDTLSPQWIERILNKNWEKVQVKFIKISQDTLYLEIPDSQVLTQQMGTAGAREFMVASTYSFTEVKGVKYVSYDFEVGDHMTPGVYSRDSWNQ